MSNFPGDKEKPDDDSLSLLIGDPVLITLDKEGPVVANIMSMKRGNQPVSAVNITNDYSELNDMEMMVRRIECSLIDEKLFWTGTMTGDSLCIAGKNCLPIKPSVDLNAPPGMSKYFFNMALLRDMGVHLHISFDWLTLHF